MDPYFANLKVDPQTEAQKISQFIQNKLHELKKDGVLVGLSGGLDSAVVAYLAKLAVGSEKLYLLNMPERDSKPKHQKDARLIANELGVPLMVKSLSAALRGAGVYRSLPIGFVPGQWLKSQLVRWGRKQSGLNKPDKLLAARLQPEARSLVARGNAYATSKHRMRMVFLYQYAQIHNLMVVGAANKTEWLTGTFSLWGCDHCADLMPVVHLYRSQLQELAAFLSVPEVILNKAADPDLMPGVEDKGQLLGAFETADQILWGFENGVDEYALVEAFGEALVQRIRILYERSGPMRKAPYTLSEWSS